MKKIILSIILSVCFISVFSQRTPIGSTSRPVDAFGVWYFPQGTVLSTDTTTNKVAGSVAVISGVLYVKNITAWQAVSGATPTFEATLTAQGATAFTGSHTINMGLHNLYLDSLTEFMVTAIRDEDATILFKSQNEANDTYSIASIATGSFDLSNYNVAKNIVLSLGDGNAQFNSTTGGVIPPRMTQTQRNAIASPVTGLLIYQTDNTPGFYYYTGSGWVRQASGSGTLQTVTDAGATTTNALDFSTHTYGDSRIRLTNSPGSGNAGNYTGGYQDNINDSGYNNAILWGGTNGTIDGHNTLNSILGLDYFRTIINGYDHRIGKSIASGIGFGGHNTITDSGNHDVIVGGSYNTNHYGNYNFIGAGSSLGAHGNNLFMGGGYGNQTKRYSHFSAIPGGNLNMIDSSQYSFIGAGNHMYMYFSLGGFMGSGNIDTMVNSSYAAMPGGRLNKISESDFSFIGAGTENNNLSGSVNSAIVAGILNKNDSSSLNASIVSGNSNLNVGSYFGSITNGSGNINRAAQGGFIGNGSGNLNYNATYTTVLNGVGNINNSNYSLIGGGEGNYIENSLSSAIGSGYHLYMKNAIYGFMGSGSQDSLLNAYSANVSGQHNTNKGSYSVSLGGLYNKIDSLASAPVGAVNLGGSHNNTYASYSSIFGYYNNLGSGNAVWGQFSQIPGGYQQTLGNTSTSRFSSILAGRQDTLNGEYSLVWGDSSRVNGSFSYAGGRRAKSMTQGAFTFADSQTGVDLTNSTANSWLARFTGGYRFTGGAFSISGAATGLSTLTVKDIADGTAGTDSLIVESNGLIKKISPTYYGTGAGSGITSLNALTGATQTFTNETNLTIVSSGTAHVLTWAGTLSDARIASAATWNAKYTLPSLTAGSVLVSDGSTILQDNSNFYYNTTTHRLSLGAGSSPVSVLDATGGTVTADNWNGTGSAPRLSFGGIQVAEKITTNKISYAGHTTWQSVSIANGLSTTHITLNGVTHVNDTLKMVSPPTGVAGTYLPLVFNPLDSGVYSISPTYYGTGAGSGDALVANPLSQFAATTSAQLRAVLSDEDGTGNILTTNGSAAALTSFPTLNQNTSGNAATATALQNARTIGGVSFDGTANITVSTATGGFTVSGGNLAVGSNDITGTGSLGATGSRLTKGWFTDLEVTNAPTIGGVAIPSISSTNTLTNKRITKRVSTTASTGSLTINADTDDSYTVTALAAALTINAPSGTPTDGQPLIIRIKDNATARALTWNAAFRIMGTVLPTTTVISKTLYIGCIWNSADSKWDVVSVNQEL